MPETSANAALPEAYAQCHEHLRATDTKRDQLLGFYAIVVGAFFGFRTQTGIDDSVLSPFMLLLGSLLAWLLIQYRRWHLLYFDCGIVLQSLIRRGGKLRTKDIRVCAENLIRNRPKKMWSKQFFSGVCDELLSVEFLTFNAFIVIAFAPGAALYPDRFWIFLFCYWLFWLLVSEYVLFKTATSVDRLLKAWPVEFSLSNTPAAIGQKDVQVAKYARNKRK